MSPGQVRENKLRRHRALEVKACYVYPVADHEKKTSSKGWQLQLSFFLQAISGPCVVLTPLSHGCSHKLQGCQHTAMANKK